MNRMPYGLRAAIKGEAIQPASFEKYLQQQFEGDLDDARTTMEALAKAYSPRDLEPRAFGLYEKFRPKIPEGAADWDAMSELDLDYILSLANQVPSTFRHRNRGL